MRFKESYLSREYHVKMQVKTSLAFIVWRFVLSADQSIFAYANFISVDNVEFMSQVANFLRTMNLRMPCSYVIK